MLDSFHTKLCVDYSVFLYPLEFVQHRKLISISKSYILTVLFFLSFLRKVGFMFTVNICSCSVCRFACCCKITKKQFPEHITYLHVSAFRGLCTLTCEYKVQFSSEFMSLLVKIPKFIFVSKEKQIIWTKRFFFLIVWKVYVCKFHC